MKSLQKENNPINPYSTRRENERTYDYNVRVNKNKLIYT